MAAGPSPRVKICGLTDPDHAVHAVRTGAWAIGLVFAPSSPRCVDMVTAGAIIDAVPETAAKVGVFVDADLELLLEAASLGLTHLQLHGRSDPTAARAATGLPVILGVPFTGPEAVAHPDADAAELVLFDAAVPGAHGGTGRTLDWAALAANRPDYPFGLAGGLRPENVRAAIGTVAPMVVDVSSGVESAPGRKDPALISAFMDAVHG